MWVCFSSAIPESAALAVGDEIIQRVNFHKPRHKLRGVWYQDNLKWNRHVDEIVRKANKRLFFLRECRRANLPQEIALTCYQTKIRSMLEYAAPIWSNT